MTHHANDLIRHVEGHIRRDFIAISGSCSPGMVGPTFYVCGIVTPPDADACQCLLIRKSFPTQQVSATRTGIGNNWNSQNFTNVALGTWMLLAQGRLVLNGPCNGSWSPPATIQVVAGGPGTCCVGMNIAAPEYLERTPPPVPFNGVGFVFGPEMHDLHQSARIRLTDTVLPEFVVGGPLPAGTHITMVKLDHVEAASIKLEQGQWFALFKNVALGKQTLHVSTNTDLKATLDLSVEEGTGCDG
jgi:hypothetical protein